MNLHEFYVGIKYWSDDDLYACLAAIDAKTDELYPMYYDSLRRYSEEDSCVRGLMEQIEDYELMNSILSNELNNR